MSSYYESLRYIVPYEVGRLRRYKGMQGAVKYEWDEIAGAYEEWRGLFDSVVNFGLNRDRQWDHYCDMRDGVRLGTNKEIRWGNRI